MSNRDDEFPFEDDDFSDDQFGDDFFTDEDDDLRGDDFDFGGFDDDEFGDDFGTMEDEETQRGPSRTFVIIAAIMIGLFVIGIIALVAIALLNQGPTPFELTSTAVAIANETTIAQGQATQTEAVILQVTQDAEATAAQQTAEAPTATPTNTVPPTVTPTPTLDATELAAVQVLTQEALDLTETSVALTAAAQDLPTEPPVVASPTPEGVPANAVAQTATALADILAPTIPATADGNGGGGGIATPTPEGANGFQPLPTALPDTGLFDDLGAAGSGGLGLMALAAFGLLGVIVVSRRLRSNGRD